MAASVPTLPDVRRGTVELLKARTDAGDAVFTTLPRSPRPPYIYVEHAGSLSTLENTRERARIYLHAYGASPDQAWHVSYQARDVFLPPPPENIAEGVYGTITYEDLEGFQKEITFSGAVHETGPREAPESRNRVLTSYLVDYF